ncbi:hydroxyisourate hydrolase [Curtobacterium sp. TC1]|uniref:hydroxyisourate hydrolase n=1 Tax=Curtobacterium sp. TC1 TaxID=2862880 RepID=UPI0021C13E27
MRATFAVPHLTTHVLDATSGTPAVGVGLTLSTVDGAVVATGTTDADGRAATVDGAVVATGTTDADGRAALGPDVLARTDHVLRFDTGAYFANAGTPTFHPFVTVAFRVTGTEHLHVPLLLSPFAYSTYRGS